MKMKKLGILACAVGALAIASSATAGIVTFDDLALSQSFSTGGHTITWDVMPVNYAGLTWQSGSPEPAASWEVVKMDASWQAAYASSLTAVSGTQAAYNGGTAGWAQSLSVQDGQFLFEGASFLGWPNSDPAGSSQITVTGSLAGVQQWQITGAVSTIAWTYFDGTGYGAVDKLVMSDGANNPWLMDSLSVTSVPDGGATLALLGGALVGLGALRRKFRG